MSEDLDRSRQNGPVSHDMTSAFSTNFCPMSPFKQFCSVWYQVLEPNPNSFRIATEDFVQKPALSSGQVTEVRIERHKCFAAGCSANWSELSVNVTVQDTRDAFQDPVDSVRHSDLRASQCFSALSCCTSFFAVRKLK